jgi:hypothetical protein
MKYNAEYEGENMVWSEMFGSERWLGKFAFQDLHNLHSSKYTLYLF